MSDADVQAIRRLCRGMPPLTARLEPWMTSALGRREWLHGLVGEHGSPFHLVVTEPFARNGRRLLDVAASAGVELEIFFARKANKALAFVDAAGELGWGVDTAGYEELRQALDRGLAPEKLMVTAAVKPHRLLELAAERRVTVALDNRGEVRRLAGLVEGRRLPVAIRLSGFLHEGEKLFSRFGFDVDEVEADVESLWGRSENGRRLEIRGLHFHLDGYDAAHRISALGRTLELVDRFRERGHDVRFVDIGGGLPVRYLDDGEEWRAFWRRLDAAVAGDDERITYRNFDLGGMARNYPYHQEWTAGPWLERVLAADVGGETVAGAFRRRALVLRCEPGRSLLDGCGMTAARVEWTKRHPAGHRVVGVEMNRTQCRTGSADFLVDPLLVPRPDRSTEPADDVPTFLTGAYCIENEMLSWRALRFPARIEEGDLVVWPNTAGYFMHFLESRSHQFPLARNLRLDPDTGVVTGDPIDLVG